MTELTQTYREQTEDLEKLTQTYREQVKNMKDGIIKEMKNTFKTFFEENPEVHALAWQQYTPYFNDGDECIFGVNDIYPATKEQYNELKESDLSVYDLDIGGEYRYGDKKGLPIPEYFTKAEKFIGVLKTIDDDIFKAAFGDHCQIIATRDGFDVSEYEHD